MDTVRYIVAIKSGPNWGNSMQIAKMRLDFQKAKRTLGTNTSKTNIVAVNGCCYGRCRTWNQGEYWKLCGQKFWEFISDDPELYKKIIKPLGHKAKERNEEFNLLYAQVINRFEREVLTDFVTNDLIDWNKLVELVSAEISPKTTKPKRPNSKS